MAPWTAEHSLLGFAEQQEGSTASFSAETAERLAQVKDAYDPDGLLIGNRTAA